VTTVTEQLFLPLHLCAMIRLTIILIALSSTFASAADRFWVGIMNTNWSDAQNWSLTSGGLGGASVPGVTDVAHFDANGMNCTLDINVDVQGIILGSDFISTLSQATYTIVIGASGFEMFGGNFTGGVAPMKTTSMSIHGGIFISSSTTTTVTNHLTIDNVMFTQAAGEFQFAGSQLQNIVILNTITPPRFFDFTINNSQGVSISNSITVLDTLKMKVGNVYLNAHEFILGETGALGVLKHTQGHMVGAGKFSRWYPVTSNTFSVPIGNETGLFPMGNELNNRFAWIGAGDGVISTAGIISASYLDADGTTNVAFSEGEKELYVTVVKDPKDSQAKGSIVKIANVK